MKNITILFYALLLSIATTAQTTIDFESGAVNDYFDYNTNLFSVELNPNFDVYLNPSANISEIKYQAGATGNDGIVLKINPVDQSNNGVITFQINIASPYITPATVWVYNDAVGTSSRIEMNNITLNAWNEWFTVNVGVDSMDPIGPQLTNYNRLKIFLQMGTDQGNLLFALDNVQVQPHLSSLSVNQFENSGFACFPNPVQDYIKIQSKENILNLRLMNLGGQEIVSKTVNNTEDNLDMSSLAKGIYFLQLKTRTTSETLKIVKN